MLQRSRLARGLVPTTVCATAALLVCAVIAAPAAAHAPVLDFEPCTAESKQGFQCATAH